MKRLIAIFLTVVLLTVSWSFEAAAAEVKKEMRAFSLDLFSYLSDNATEKSLAAKADEAVKFAAENGFSAIFVKAACSGGSVYDSQILPNVARAVTKCGDFDMMAYLLKAAHKQNLSVYAVLDVGMLKIDGYQPGKNDPAVRFSPWVTDGKFNVGVPQVQSLITAWVREFAASYAVDGVMVDGFWYEKNPQDQWMVETYAEDTEAGDYRRHSVDTLLLAMKAAFKEKNPKALFGAATEAVWASEKENPNGSATTGAQSYYDNFADSLSWATSGELDFLVPKIGYAITDDDMNYRTIIEWWSEQVCASTKLYTANMADMVGDGFEKKYEIVHQIQVNRNHDVDGHILCSYETLSDSSNEIMSVIAPLYTKDSVFDMSANITVKKGFKCTRPGKSTTVSYSTYYITGICDPDLPVYMNGKELTDIGSAGVFGAFVDLEVGSNVFTFTQGSESVTVTVNRKETTTSSTTDKISGMFPSYDDFIYAGKETTITCTAPAGATVTATLSGKTYTLQQQKTASDGTAVRFSATITAPDASSSGKTDDLGKVTYALSYKGKKSSYTSTGKVFCVGKNARAAVKVIEPLGLGTVYAKADSNSDVTAYLYTGTVEYITGSSGSFFTLPMGGYIPKGSVDPVAGKVDLSHEFTKATLKTYDGYEKITLTSDRRTAFTASMTEDKLVLTVYNVTDAAKVNVAGSRVLADCTVTKKSDSVTYTFTQTSKKALWGYHVSYEGNNTCLTLKYPPTISTDAKKPLSGITVIVDPGHGDHDLGAWGTAGLSGPCEADLNMAISEKLVKKLKDLGATVYSTRTTEIKTDFEGRLGFSDAIKPDFFISIHHNSVNTNVNMGKPNGVEVFYHSPINSKVFAQNLVNKLHEYTGRNIRGKGAIYADYRVTRMYYCPSVLVEVGFVPNPVEYSELVKPEMIEKEAQALVDGLVKTVKEY